MRQILLKQDNDRISTCKKRASLNEQIKMDLIN